MALVIAFFTVPFGGLTVLADEKVYDDIEDGEYEIDVKLLKEGTDSPSAAAGFMEETATLTIEEGKLELTFYIPDNPAMSFNKFELEGIEPVKKEVEDMFHYTFTLNELKTKLTSKVSYEVSMPEHDFELVHDNVAMDIELVGLDGLPKVEKEEPEEDPKEPETPEVPEEDTGNENESGSENEDDADTEEGTEEEDDSVDEGDPLITDADKTDKVKYVTDTPMIESYFENPVTLLYKDGKKYIQIDGNSGNLIESLTINGEEVTWGDKQKDNTYTFQFEINSLSEKLDFGMVIDTGRPDFGKMEHTVQLWFEEIKEEPKEDPKKEPKEDPKEEPKPEVPKKESQLKPDEAYTIDYVIKQEDGIQDSVANNFFTGKATLLVKDGKTYAQIKITSGEMVKELKNKYGEALLIKENKDGSIVVQLRVDNDLSNMELTMKISVPAGAIPGFPGYDEEHGALLVFDQASKEKIDVGNHLLAGSNDANNKNGPYDKESDKKPIVDENGGKKKDEDNGDLKKPTFGDGEDQNKNGKKVVKTNKTDNPQTGDTTSIILYSLLLIGSLIPLAAKFRRRFI